MAPRFDCLIPVPKPPLDEDERLKNIHVIREPLLSLLELRQRPGKIALPVIAVIAKREMRLWQVWVERHCAIESIPGRYQLRRVVVSSAPVTSALRTGKICPGQHKIGIQPHRLLI